MRRIFSATWRVVTRVGDRQPSGGRGGGPRLRNLTFRYTRASVSMQSTKGESHDQNAPLVTPGVVLPRRGPLDPLLRASEAQLPDPFRNTGLEGGGWIRPFQPQNNEPTNWDVTIWPPANNAIPQGTWLQYQYREPDGTPAIFIQVGPGQWVNNGNGHQFAFVEIERRPDHVTLLDRSRGALLPDPSGRAWVLVERRPVELQRGWLAPDPPLTRDSSRITLPTLRPSIYARSRGVLPRYLRPRLLASPAQQRPGPNMMMVARKRPTP